MAASRTFDKKEVSDIFNHPKVHSWITDDNSPEYHDPIMHPAIVYITDESKRWVVQLDPLNGVACSVHVAALPEVWGVVDKFVKEAIKWGVVNTKYMKAVAMIPEYNKPALAIARRVGFVTEGVLKKSFLKNWKLHDQVILGLCKGDI